MWEHNYQPIGDSLGLSAIVAAIRAATGLELVRVPVRPQDIALPRQ